jgi:hypothetical protein
MEHAAAAGRAVVRPRRLDLVALVASLRPHAPQLLYSLSPVLYESLDLAREADEPVILLNAEGRFALFAITAVAEVDLRRGTALPVLELLASLFVAQQVLRTTGLNHHGEKMVEAQIVKDYQSKTNPHKSGGFADTPLQCGKYYVEDGVDVESNQHIERNAKDGAERAHKVLDDLLEILGDGIEHLLEDVAMVFDVRHYLIYVWLHFD